MGLSSPIQVARGAEAVIFAMVVVAGLALSAAAAAAVVSSSAARPLRALAS
jgi:hypothetical protein